MHRFHIAVIPLLALASVRVLAAPGDTVPLPNPGFETAVKDAVDGHAMAGFQPATGSGMLGLPEHWTAYQWGPNDKRFSIAVEQGAGRNGSRAVRAENIDPEAKAGVYTHIKLDPGTYRLSVWVRTKPGQTARVAIYLATVYSRPFRVTDQWTQVSLENTVSKPIESAEINIQNSSGEANVVWFDDIQLTAVAPVHYNIVDDTRSERPRTLLFSPINVNYLRDTAAEWAARGFRGFLFDGIMASWPSDVWAVDGKPNSRGEDDGLLREVKACNDKCRQVGIDSNFVKVAFYDNLPDWFDDAAWAKLAANFREGARFARLSGCAGIAIDTEYVAQQYSPSWEGYKSNPHPLPELKAKIRERWRTVVSGMLAEYPDMVLLTLPEGLIYYGDLYKEIFVGMLQACAEAHAPGGFHLLTEGSYHITDIAAMDSFLRSLNQTVCEEIPPALLDYWKTRCSLAPGAWPLGYYRAINDAKGKFLGWSGKQATFGDRIVGSYADKSEWYSPAVFADQMTAMNSFARRYNWIYGHGDVFWQWSEAQQKEYQHCFHRSFGNAILPTVPNLDAYFAAIAHPRLAVRQ